MKSLTLVTGPTAEPVTLDEAKAWVRVDGSDSDAQIAALITAAWQTCEEFLRRSLISQTWKLTLDLEGSGLELGEGVYDLPVTALYGGLANTIKLPKGPVSAISSVVTYDTSDTSSTFDTDNYRLDSTGDRLVLTTGSSWPSNLRPQAAVDITYVAGYGTTSSAIPMPIKTGILIQVGTLFEQRGMCDDPSGMAPGARQLWNQYRVYG